jgi:UDP-glucose 4-epimerase
MGGTMLEDFDTAHRLKAIAMRYFYAAGADPDGKIGKCRDPEIRPIPLDSAARSGPKLIVTSAWAWHQRGA